MGNVYVCVSGGGFFFVIFLCVHLCSFNKLKNADPLLYIYVGFMV